jgi:hypothetical protein
VSGDFVESQPRFEASSESQVNALQILRFLERRPMIRRMAGCLKFFKPAAGFFRSRTHSSKKFVG